MSDRHYQDFLKKEIVRETNNVGYCRVSLSHWKKAFGAANMTTGFFSEVMMCEPDAKESLERFCSENGLEYEVIFRDNAIAFNKD